MPAAVRAPLRRPPAGTLSPAMVRRRRPQLLLPAPAASAPAVATTGSGDTLRFVVTCYAAGLVFFLIMLS